MAGFDPYICVECHKRIAGKVLTEDGPDGPVDYCVECHERLSADEDITRRRRAHKRNPSGVWL